MSALAIQDAETAKKRSTLRVVLTSFVAGMGAMAFVGLAAPIVSQSGLAVAEAQARPVERTETVLTMHEVAMIRAQLADADASLRERTAATDAVVARLERLSRE